MMRRLMTVASVCIALLLGNAADAKEVQKKAVVSDDIWHEQGLIDGAREGYSQERARLMVLLEKRATLMDTTFRFDQLLVDGKMLPPVVAEVEKERVLIDGRLREVGREYRILEPAKLVTQAPHWREFFAMDSTDQYEAIPVTIPKKQRAEFERGRTDGVILGRRQAGAVMSSQMLELQQTFYGVLKFIELKKKGMISAPILANADRGVVREDDRLAIDDWLFEIRKGAVFTDAQSWKVILHEARRK